MTRLPTLFVSHGSPMLAIQKTAAHEFLETLGQILPPPKAVLIVSAHWETLGASALTTSIAPETIHDFGGFPPALFEIEYPAPGAPATAARAASLLEQAGHAVKANATRGLDHGAWVPLSLMYKDADIPVTQLSLVRGATPAENLALGRALSALRDEGTLIIGSGSLTHNLYEFRGQAVDAPVPSWVSDFDVWMKGRLELGDTQSLAEYRNQAPHAVRNHPTEEHLSPLFVALGAAGTLAAAKRLHSSYEYGVLAMDVYAFE